MTQLRITDDLDALLGYTAWGDRRKAVHKSQ